MLFIEMLLKDIKMLFHYRQIMIFSLIFLLLILGLLGFIFSDFMAREPSVSKIEVALVNNDENKMSELLIKDFRNNEAFIKLFNLEEYESELAKKKYSTGELAAIIEMPEGFSQSLLHYKNNPIHVTLNPNKPLESLILKNIMDSYSRFVSTADIAVYSLYSQIKDIGMTADELNRINDAFSIDMVFTALGRDDFYSYHPITTIPSSSSIEYFVIATGVLLVMYIGLIGTNFMIYERDTRCLSRYKLSSGSMGMFILSKITALFLFGFLQIGVLLLPIVLLMKVNLGYSVFNIFVFLSISLIHIISFAILLGSYIPTEKFATLVGNIGIFIFGLLGGSFIPLQLMPALIQRISQATPNYWIIKGFLYLFKGYELIDIKTSIFILTISSIFFIGLSIIRLKQSRWSQ